jgi:hypothetical protein
MSQMRGGRAAKKGPSDRAHFMQHSPIDTFAGVSDKSSVKNVLSIFHAGEPLC